MHSRSPIKTAIAAFAALWIAAPALGQVPAYWRWKQAPWTQIYIGEGIMTITPDADAGSAVSATHTGYWLKACARPQAAYQGDFAFECQFDGTDYVKFGLARDLDGIEGSLHAPYFIFQSWTTYSARYKRAADASEQTVSPAATFAVGDKCMIMRSGDKVQWYVNGSKKGEATIAEADRSEPLHIVFYCRLSEGGSPKQLSRCKVYTPAAGTLFIIRGSQ